MMSKISLDKIMDDINRLDGWFDGGCGIKMARLQSRTIEPSTEQKYPFIWAAIQEIGGLLGKKPIYYLINKLLVGKSTNVHTDTVVGLPQRWHLPVMTNSQCYYWDESFTNLSEDIGIHFIQGVWIGPIPYTIKHRVWNDGPTDRIHLVVDLEN